MCRKRARRQTLTWVLALLFGVTFVFSNYRYVRNFIEGPYAFEPDAMAHITDAETTPDYFVSVVGEKVFDTGIQEVTTTTRNGVKEGTRVSAGYYAFVVGDRLLIVKSANQPPNRISGELTPFTSDLAFRLTARTQPRVVQRPRPTHHDGGLNAGYASRNVVSTS